MRVFLTGGTGFIGGAVARLLRERGDDVVALVRRPDRAAALDALGCELVQGDLGDVYVMRAALEGADGVVHCAAHYELGIPASRRPAMHAANVGGTENVLRAAGDAGVPRVVYVSSVVVFGNTRGEIVDESYRHPGGGHTSYYEETKVLAHEVARRLAGEGLPLVIVQPAGVYGPHDDSQLGNALRQFVKGRLPLLPFPGLGINAVHRDDVAAGILLALDNGRPGEQYVLGGEITTMRDLMGTLARVSGRRPPRGVLPTAVIRMSAPVARLFGPLLGLPRDIGEVISSSDGVTFLARDDKARAELGYAPRDLETGLRDMLRAEGVLPA